MRLDGRLVAVTFAVLVVALSVFGRASLPAFLVLAVLLLAATAYAAHFWPRTTLVGAALVTLADPSVTPRFFPEQLNLGPIGASEPADSSIFRQHSVDRAPSYTLTSAGVPLRTAPRNDSNCSL